MQPLPPALRATPALGRWLRLTDDRGVVAMTGKVEIGQGLLTALRLIVAEELDVAPDRVYMISAQTGHTPDEGVTAGSQSIETSGAALRQASAWARRLLLERAAAHLGVAVQQLEVRDGEIAAPGVNERLDYWQLQRRPFDFEITERTTEKVSDEYRLIGRSGHRRLDVPDKAIGAAFVHDRDAELHARVVRPPSLHHRLARLDARLPPPGVLIRDGSFVAVAHPHEAAAAQLAVRLASQAQWRRLPTAPMPVAIDDALLRQAARFFIEDGVPRRTAPRVPLDTDHRASYSRPFLMHGTLGPSAATARWRDERLHVECASQGVEPLRQVLARTLKVDAALVTVRHAPGAGCYGHNGADDAALDAALVARAVPGRKVLLKWSREDEHGFEPLGPAMRMDLGAQVDSEGCISAWSHDVTSFTHTARPSPRAVGVDLLAAQLLREPAAPTPPQLPMAAEVGAHRNARPLYRFPAQQLSTRFLAECPVRTSALRGLGAQGNVFAIESFMDELALAAGVAPAEFRRRHLDHDRRALAVLDAAVDLAGGLAGGRGIGIARYKNRQCCAAVVAEVAVDEITAQVRAQRLWIAADAGQVVDPDGLRNQLEGGAVQATSWCLKEAVAFDANGMVISRDWDSYPILRFSEVPTVETVLLDNPHEAPLGAGEATVGPTSAALANAVFAASGVRVRDLPLTPERIRVAASAPSTSLRDADQTLP